MSKKKKNIVIKQGLDEWVMTYGDMMSLLLTFFVLIVSFSSMQQTKFEQAANSLRDAFGVLASPEPGKLKARDEDITIQGLDARKIIKVLLKLRRRRF